MYFVHICQERKVIFQRIRITSIFMYYFVIESAGTFHLQPNKGQRRILEPSVTLDLALYTPLKSWRFAICQVHVKQYNVTLSLVPSFKSYGSSDKGSNVAVLRSFSIIHYYYHFYLRSESKDHSFKADIMAVPYTNGGKLNLDFLFSFNL